MKSSKKPPKKPQDSQQQIGTALEEALKKMADAPPKPQGPQPKPKVSEDEMYAIFRNEARRGRRSK